MLWLGMRVMNPSSSAECHTGSCGNVTGKDGNPLNEVELVTESLMDNGGVLRGNNVIKLVPGESVLKLGIGDRIELTAAQFDRLAKAFFAEIEAKFL